jgi:hypothetical protein
MFEKMLGIPHRPLLCPTGQALAQATVSRLETIYDGRGANLDAVRVGRHSEPRAAQPGQLLVHVLRGAERGLSCWASAGHRSGQSCSGTQPLQQAS